MTKYPHGLTLNAVCAAIEDYQRHEDSVPEEGILAAFNTLLGHSDIAEAFRALEQRAEAAEAKLAELEKQRDALVSEHASLSEFIQKDCCVYRSGIVVNAEAYLPETPATAAYLKSLRAEGVDDLATFAGEQYQQHAGDKSQQKKWKSVVFLCTQFAAQLRAGKDGE